LKFFKKRKMKMKKIISHWLYLLALISVLLSDSFGQTFNSIYDVPSTYRSLMIVSADSCPVAIDSPRVIYFGNNSFKNVYSITNQTSDAISKIQIKEISSLGYQENSSNIVSNENDLFLPKERVSNFDFDIGFRLLKLDKKTKKQLNREPEIVSSPTKVWVIIVTKVEFADGTFYDNSKAYDEIVRFIDKLGITSRMSGVELASKTNELQDFVNKLAN
jgi:hypothetical protein